MQLSRLRMEHYNLMELRIEPLVEADAIALGSYADPSSGVFECEVGTHQAVFGDGETRFTVTLTLGMKPKDGDTKFPYRIAISLMGVFDGRQLDEQKREPLIAANGAALLYGVARDTILNLTSRCVAGPVMLPTVHFADVGKQVEERIKQRAERATSTPAPSVAN